MASEWLELLYDERLQCYFMQDTPLGATTPFYADKRRDWDTDAVGYEPRNLASVRAHLAWAYWQREHGHGWGHRELIDVFEALPPDLELHIAFNPFAIKSMSHHIWLGNERGVQFNLDAETFRDGIPYAYVRWREHE